MSTELLLKIEKHILNDVIHFLKEKQYPSVILVADQNTYRVLGRDAEAALKQSGIGVKTVLLGGTVIHPDEATKKTITPAEQVERVF